MDVTIGCNSAQGAGNPRFALIKDAFSDSFVYAFFEQGQTDKYA